MMRSNFLKASLTAVSLVAGLTACDADKLTEVNANPNAPERVQSSALFTSGVAGVMQNLRGAGMEHGLGGVWDQHFAEIQYPEDDLSKPRNATIEFFWTALYAGTLTGPTQGSLQEFVQILKQETNPNIIAPTLVMRAFTIEAITDFWGDVPFTQAGQGADDYTPAYDSQQSIYDSIFVSLDRAVAIMDPEDLVEGHWLSDADPVYAGDLDQWTKLANSLHARAAMRISFVDPSKATAELTKALSGPVFESNDDNAAVVWPGGTLANPLCLNWSDADCGGTRDDQRVSKRLVDTLKVNNDPRLFAYAEPTGASQKDAPSTCDIPYRGYPNGLNTPSETNTCTGKVFSLGDYSRPTLAIRSATSPSYIMTYAEILFIKAEAAARNLIPGDPAALYNEAITASMEQWGIAPGDIAAYLGQAKVTYKGGAAGLNQIAYEKWVALYNQETEAYAEWRRLDYPVLVPGPNQTPSLIPTRLPYPDIENSLNAENLAAAEAAQGSADNTTIKGRVWWDTK